MKAKVLLPLLGFILAILLASAVTAQGSMEKPPPSSTEVTQPPPPLTQLRQPHPPLKQLRQPTEPPGPPTPTPEEWPFIDRLPRPEEPRLPREAAPIEFLLPSKEAFLPGMAPAPPAAPLLTRAGVTIQATIPAITVIETYDSVWGYHSNTDDTLLLRLYDGAILKGFGVARTDGVGYFYGEFFDQGRQVAIDPGDTVQVGNGVVTDTIEVVLITGTANPLTDMVTGVITATGLSLPVSVTVAFPWAAVSKTVSTTDGAGNFTADFSDIYDLSTFEQAQVSYEDGGGNWVSAWLSAVNFFVVFETYDAVMGYGTPGATVTITRTPQIGLPESDTVTASSTDGYYGLGFSAIDPNDIIKVDDGTSVISTTVVALTATATPWVNDIVSGTAPTNSEVGVLVSQVSPLGFWRLDKKTVTSGLSGDYSADFSGVLDLDRWSNIYVVSPDTNGNETLIFYHPPLACVNETYNNVWGHASPGALVTATLKDFMGATKETASATSDSASRYYEIGFEADVENGDSVEVTGGGISTTIEVTTLTALADTYGDTISGLAPATSDLLVNGWRWEYVAGPSFDEIITSSVVGTYTDDLSGRYDLYNGYEGHVYYSQPDEHKLFVHYHAPSVHVSQTHDGIWGFVDRANIPVTVTLWSATDTLKDQALITSSETDGYFWAWYDGSVDIVPGDRVEVETASWTDVVTVTALSLDFNIDTDMVSGSGAPNTIVWVQVAGRYGGRYGEMLVPTDDSGHFTADLSDQIDIKGGDLVWLGSENDDHNENYVYRGVPYLRVNQTHNWIEGVATPNATVNITVTRGTSTFIGSTTASADGGFWIDGWQFSPWLEDIEVGDAVEMTSNGVYRTLTVVAMTGIPDIDGDTISGNITGAAEGDPVRIEVWERDGGGAETTTNASGYYFTDLGGWDLKAGHQVAVWYITSDGDECGMVARYLQIRADINQEWIDGDTKPEATVNITLTNGTIKGTATTDSNDEGYYGTNIPTDDTKADIATGDTIQATANGREASLYVDILTVEVTPETDIISGYAPPHTALWVDIWGYDWFDTQSDDEGYYSFDASEVGIDLQPGSEGRVGYRIEEGHEIWAYFRVPFARVNYTWDNVDGRAAPYATVSITVTDMSGFKGSNSTTARSDGWFGVWAGADVVPGDTVHVTSPAGLDATLEVITITGQVDVGADIVYGTMYGGVFPVGGYVEVWRPPYWDPYGWMSIDIDETGNYLADFSGQFDIQLGDEAAVWYIQPDGNQIGIALYTVPLRTLRVHQTNDWVIAEGDPGNTVYITVTKGLVKGSATVIIDDYGWAWTEFYSGTERVDIEVGDIVEASSKGYVRSAEVITITGQVDPFADTASGLIIGAAEYPADLHLEVWVPGIDLGWLDGVTDPFAGYYFFFLSGIYDIQMGDDFSVWYHEPDGDQIGSVFSALRLGVSSSNNDFWGQTGPPFTPITFTLRDSGGFFKDQAIISADKDGRFYGGFWSVGIEPGDTLEAETFIISDTLYVLPLPASVDLNNDLINGSCTPNAYLYINIWREGSWTRLEEIVADGNGDFTADFGAIGWDIQVGDYVDIDCRIPQGHTVHRGFQVEPSYHYIYLPLIMKNASGHYVPSWMNIMTEDFESAFPSGNWSAGGSTPAGEVYWDEDDFKPYQGGWSAWPASGGPYAVDPQYSDYPNDLLSWMCYGPFSLSNALDAELLFHFWNKSEPTDSLYWGASVDGSMYYGTSVSGDSGGWQFMNFDLTDVYFLGDLTGEPQVWIVFVFFSNESITDQGAFVDNIVLRKQVMVPGAPVGVAPEMLSSELPSTLSIDSGVAISIGGERVRPVRSPTPTSMPEATPTPTFVPTPTHTPTEVPTPTDVATSTPAITPTLTFTPTPTDTVTAVPSETMTLGPTLGRHIGR